VVTFIKDVVLQPAELRLPQPPATAPDIGEIW